MKMLLLCGLRPCQGIYDIVVLQGCHRRYEEVVVRVPEVLAKEFSVLCPTFFGFDTCLVL